MLLFYLSWCGHCIEYSDTYVRIGAELKGMANTDQHSEPGSI